MDERNRKPRKTLFIVDDKSEDRKKSISELEMVYKTFTPHSAEEMFMLLLKIIPDLILLDIKMPGMDGFLAMYKLRADERYKSIPVIFLTERYSTQEELYVFESGALDFIQKSSDTKVLLRRIETHIEIDNMIKKSQKAVRDMHNATISVVADMVEHRDNVTGGHIERTQGYLEALIDELLRLDVYTDELSKWDMDLVLPSAQLHDVGKIKISDLVLNKKGKLTKEEFEDIKKHCKYGEDIIDRIISKSNDDDGFLIHAKRFAGYHHEKWDGNGYPRGLKGEEIPLEGRIMAIADVYDALVSKRPYKEPFTHEKAVEIIKEGSETHFDPKIVEAFLNAANDFRAEHIRSCE